MKLTELETKFKESYPSGIRTFLFDDMSQINADKETLYPLLLFKPPVGIYKDISSNDKLTFKEWGIDFFVFDIHNITETDNRNLAEVWEQMEDLGRSTIKKLLEDNTNIRIGEVNVTYGHHFGNDNLVGVRFQTPLLSFYSC